MQIHCSTAFKMPSWLSGEVLAQGWSGPLLEQPGNSTPQAPDRRDPLSLGHCPLPSVSQGRGSDNRGSTCAQSSLRLFKPAHAQLALSPYQLLPVKTTTTGLLQSLPASTQDFLCGERYPAAGTVICNTRNTNYTMLPNFSLLICIWPPHTSPKVTGFRQAFILILIQQGRSYYPGF